MSTSKHKTIYTIGHSTHSLEEFLAMLTSVGVEVVADVRSLPGSRKFPQFNQDALADSLRKHNIDYQYFEDLGGEEKQAPILKTRFGAMNLLEVTPIIWKRIALKKD